LISIRSRPLVVRMLYTVSVNRSATAAAVMADTDAGPIYRLQICANKPGQPANNKMYYNGRIVAVSTLFSRF